MALCQLEIEVTEQWTSPEVRRNLAEILLRQGMSEGGRRLLEDAAACAERQGALGWAPFYFRNERGFYQAVTFILSTHIE